MWVWLTTIYSPPVRFSGVMILAERRKLEISSGIKISTDIDKFKLLMFHCTSHLTISIDLLY